MKQARKSGVAGVSARMSILVTLSVLALPVLAADVEVAVQGLRGGNGQVRLALYEREEGFRKEDRARQVLALPASAGEVRGVFRDLPPGRYAVIAYHDENGDGKLNLRFGMFPKEGYGLSNNPEISGPPKFRDAAFEVKADKHRLTIRLGY